MTKRCVFIAVALLVAGCGSERGPEEKARSDAADVAMVRAAQDRHPPVQPIAPEPITVGDMARNGFLDSGCSFVPSGPPDTRPVLLTSQKTAVLKLDGKLIILAADSASAGLPNETRAEYAGRTHALRLVKDSGTGYPSTKVSGHWLGSLIITDRFERPVFNAGGTLDCGA